MTEKELTKDIRKLLKQHGGHFIKVWGGPMSKAGVSDLLGCMDGRAVAIEVKRPTGKTTEAQERFLRKWREAGGTAFIARSVEDVIRALDLPTLC
jgi:Holliday junction resolvase